MCAAFRIPMIDDRIVYTNSRGVIGKLAHKREFRVGCEKQRVWKGHYMESQI